MNPSRSPETYRTKRSAAPPKKHAKGDVSGDVRGHAGRLAASNNPTGILMLMCVFLLAVLAAFWHSNGLEFDLNGFRLTHKQNLELSEEVRDSLDRRHVNRKFILSGVHLGMTQQMVQMIHKNAQVTQDRAGEPAILIPTAKGMLVAWLKDVDNVVEMNGRPIKNTTTRVYRLRLDEAFDGLSEADIVNRYSREYGRPIDAECSRAGQTDTPRCTYRWWGGDGIQVQATAKKKTDINGRAYTQLTTIATNTITNPKISVISLSNVSGEGRWGYVN
jgi:hypothetical protein